MKVLLFAMIVVFLACALAYDYTIEGPVENVIYVTSKTYPCYVAMSTGDGRQYYYHAAYNLAQCEFAERARSMEQNVKIYGEIGDESSNNGLLGIEFADTKAKFWFPKRAI